MMTINDLVNIGIWAVTGETGMSSKCIAAVMLGVTPECNASPSDPDDFKRCLKLVRAVPAIRDQLWRMNTLGPEWAAIILNWDKIEKQLLEDAPECLEDCCWFYSARNTFDLMKRILKTARA